MNFYLIIKNPIKALNNFKEARRKKEKISDNQTRIESIDFLLRDGLSIQESISLFQTVYSNYNVSLKQYQNEIQSEDESITTFFYSTQIK